MFIIIINADINATTPNPPIWISSKITIWPKILHVEYVGTVTSPVTHVDVVAVNKASIYFIETPFLLLIGNVNKILPINITIKKLINIICVVERDIFYSS